MRSDMRSMVADGGAAAGPATDGTTAPGQNGAWSEKRGFHRGQAEVGPRPRRRHPPPRGSLQQALLQQVGLIGVLDCVRLLADALGQGGQPDRPAGESTAQDIEDGPVDLVEPQLVDTET